MSKLQQFQAPTSILSHLNLGAGASIPGSALVSSSNEHPLPFKHIRYYPRWEETRIVSSSNEHPLPFKHKYLQQNFVSGRFQAPTSILSHLNEATGAVVLPLSICVSSSNEHPLPFKPHCWFYNQQSNQLVSSSNEHPLPFKRTRVCSAHSGAGAFQAPTSILSHLNLIADFIINNQIN